MASLLLELAISGSRKADGSPNAGGKVYCYQIGAGTTKQTVYRDWQKLAAHTQPIILTAAGKAEIWVDAPCTIRVEDSNGVMLHNIPAGVQGNAGIVEVTNAGVTGVNPNTGSIAAGQRTMLDTLISRYYASSGGLDGKFRGTYGTVDRYVKDEIEEVHINARRFGALGNGIKDDTTAIQAALNAASALGAGVVFLPRGTYLATALTVPGGVTLRGAGVGATSVKNTNTANNLLAASAGAASIENLSLSAVTNSSGTAVSLSAGTQYRIRNVNIDGHENGIAGNGLDSQSLVADVLISLRNASTGSCVSGPLASSAVQNAILTPGATGKGVVVNTSSNALVLLVGVNVVSSATAFDITSTGAAGSVILIGCAAGGTTADLAISAASTAVLQSGCIWRSGGVNDARTGSPVYFALTGTGSVTPLPLQSDLTRIINTGAAATVTVNAPADAIDGMLHTIYFCNNSGGAMTWTLNAAFKSTGAIAPATGNKIAILWCFEKATDSWSEVARSGSTTI